MRNSLLHGALVSAVQCHRLWGYACVWFAMDALPCTFCVLWLSVRLQARGLHASAQTAGVSPSYRLICMLRAYCRSSTYVIPFAREPYMLGVAVAADPSSKPCSTRNADVGASVQARQVR